MGIDKGKGKAKAKGTRTAAQKQYTSDSLTIANNYRVMNNPKASIKKRDAAENTIRDIYERSPVGRVKSMGPAGKEVEEGLSAPDYFKKGGTTKYKKGGIVGGKTPKSSSQKKISSSASLKKKK